MRTTEVARRIGVSHTAVKRWVREFVGLDPVAGMRSGHAREHTLDQIWKIFLGGYLIRERDFSARDARAIIEGLRDWFKEYGFYPPTKRPDRFIKRYEVFLYRKGPSTFDLWWRGSFGVDSIDKQGLRGETIHRETFIFEPVDISRLKGMSRNIIPPAPEKLITILELGFVWKQFERKFL